MEDAKVAHVYYPKGVCSRKMTVEVENGVITNVEIEGGCNGNIQALCRLVTGMTAEDAVAKISGIRCGFKKTSCPDQLAVAITRAVEEQ
ncbi:MAG: TIGR03905 family TSCPD domain-containing protein [Clostridia bacterium]|nr:TIGR03905 family TSCPD domain-containing protein [Oscillospiraceae bacterium]MBQ1954321.1 TIGR03905 family TSCPD domain-containing protein [Clostridia bacterium]